MNPAPAEPGRWSRTRWYGLLATVLIAQFGLIFWLGERAPVYPQRPSPVAALRIAGPAFEDLLALSDPTLFALPHQQGFAGQAWLTIPRIGAEPFVWSEPARWLILPIEQLGTVFRSYIASNQFGISQPSFPLRAQLAGPEPGNLLDLPTQSTFRLAGELSGLLLNTDCELAPQTNSEILTNSVIQLLVTGDGRPVSATLLSSSGSKEADQLALHQATHARFQPRSGSSARRGPKSLFWGQMIFEWYTVPPAATNAASASP